MEFKTEPYPHQLTAFNRFKNTNCLALLADMGTGKSKIAIDIVTHKFAKGLHNRVLVIAPADVHPQWINEQFPLHCNAEWRGFSYSSDSRLSFIRAMDEFLMFSKNNQKLSVFTMNFEAFARPGGLEMARQFINTSTLPPVIIIDEASRIKNPSAITAKNINKLRDQYPDSFRTVLTGTPAAKSPVDLWSIYDFLQKRFMGCAYVTFVHTHSIIVKNKLKIKGRIITTESAIDKETHRKVCAMIDSHKLDGEINDYAVEAVRRRFGLSERDFWLIAGSPEFTRFKNIEMLQKKIAPVTFTVLKSDCLELPEKVYQKIELELSSEQKKIITMLSKNSVAVYDDHLLTIEAKALLGMRILQVCGGFFSHNTDIEGQYDVTPIQGKNAKLAFIKGDLPEIGEQQFIVWAVFTPEIAMLAEELGKDYSIGVLDGNIEKSDRPDIVKRFKSGELQGLISHPSVGGYGLNLQGAGVQYWYSRNYRTEARLQAEDRSHRIGITKSPIYKDLVYNIKFEHDVLDSLKEGADINAQFVSKDVNDMFKILK